MNEDVLYLVFIRYIGKNADNNFIYEMYFAENLDELWGDNFEHKPAGICRDLEPYENTYTEIKKVTLNFQLDIAQEQTCFSMQDVIDGCCALAWENIDGKDYPEEGRVILPFGIEFGDVENMLAKKRCFFV